MRRLYLATINSWNGLVAAARSEAAIREELALLLLSIPLAYFVGVTTARSIELVLVLMLLLAVELLNTAIEKLADRLTLDHDEQIGRVKDMGSAAVGVALLIAGAVWIFAIAERLGIV
ncbi:diacylglycerol kinase [Bradyrhizobium sp. LHD-71]|uniref:diacylglycerol kinase n=1 Tax=Bradyrhizobium sp. LHD-71 TaxID=3072141 RepID=UPI00280F4DC3|nr:diacylglycerol kinase [Bradyrhizobium sp. LHD-71]MDQ8728643.1 diacylglycerol kinase [Bradyrhizobium sp. LHD-71]